MNKYNHFLISFIVLFLMFGNNVSIIEIAIFSYVFGLLLDLNLKIGEYLKKQSNHRRTWIEEPFGLVLIGGSSRINVKFSKKLLFFYDYPTLWIAYNPRLSYYT